ncbi:T. brucei spp.-specific protein [Trypanosoma brucei gambiense DAL972]|uniref:T. brucei spp.-specific protein n=1 Tax=Trypanosoma brucei gambiense (strain MHOM/CI/86/DAL972) TaxID=679716 RepID=D0A473_TRYB9|nr:T. brucei spp.-specific protein [Trypanosoma brucei gambiense DAL972]CBH16067.1 T. brucei spp.-specific protein [Trypanosoma brucei gambiense DAL972]|eukprot:XP_011778331.1 T. brucei spp.-specific protein [Trypanosoma brucei gambiense DAL972]
MRTNSLNIGAVLGVMLVVVDIEAQGTGAVSASHCTFNQRSGVSKKEELGDAMRVDNVFPGGPKKDVLVSCANKSRQTAAGIFVHWCCRCESETSGDRGNVCEFFGDCECDDIYSTSNVPKCVKGDHMWRDSSTALRAVLQDVKGRDACNISTPNGKEILMKLTREELTSNIAPQDSSSKIFLFLLAALLMQDESVAQTSN